jgi:hypothetical protein
MSVPWNEWAFLSFVRIFDSGSEKNNTLQISWDISGTGSAIATLPAGLYYCGLNGDGDDHSLQIGPWDGDENDDELFGATGEDSLLLELAQEIYGNTSIFINLGLEVGSGAAGGQVPSGKVVARMTGVSTAWIKLEWSHANTTMDPAWFGIAKTAGVYADTTFYGNATTVISDMSSSLALIGQRVLGAEPQYEGYLEAGVVAGDGSTSWKRFGSGYEEISEFIVNVDGLPRDSIDTGFQSLRRWSQQLVFNRARKRFLYVPDMGHDFGAGVIYRWDPDDQSDTRRWGWRDLGIDGLRGFRFEDIRRRPTSNREWQLRVPVRSFTA